MTYDPNSRYHGVDTAQLTVIDATGEARTIAYSRRRIIPDYTDQPLLAEHRVTEGERLDVITARYADDPQRFWMLCDANTVLSPAELEVVGRLVRISMARR
ncbi:MAG: hypothetical protein ABWX65_09600 [Mycetocola sp.]